MSVHTLVDLEGREEGKQRDRKEGEREDGGKEGEREEERMEGRSELYRKGMHWNMERERDLPGSK